MFLPSRKSQYYVPIHYVFFSQKLSYSQTFTIETDSRYTLFADKSLQTFWSNFFSLEKNLVEILLWVKSNLFIFVAKANKNKAMFSFHVIKDQVNYILKVMASYNIKYVELYMCSSVEPIIRCTLLGCVNNCRRKSVAFILEFCHKIAKACIIYNRAFGNRNGQLFDW